MGDLDNSSFPERKVEDFYFKQLKKLQIFKSPQQLPLPRSHLLAVSNKYGLCFVGCPSGVKIIKTDIIGKLNKEDERNINAVVSEYPSIYIDIGEAVRHIGISCDNTTLSVCYEKGTNVMMRVYDIPTVCSQTGSKEMLGEVVLSTDAGSSLINLLWNPAIPNIFAACFSNGSVTMWEMSDTKITKSGTLPVSTSATAICWSPKGKQIVVGHKDGHLTQYTPTLEPKKETPCPEMFQGSPRQVTSICWISAAVFLNVYTTDEDGEVPQCVLVCNATKTSPIKQTINFDDVYFGMNEDREKGFYTTHLSEWNVTMSVSCNAFEVAVFGNEGKWEKWTFEDEKRAEMPLTRNNEETFPMGMAIDLTSTIPIVEHELSYPPAPLLLLLSTDGVLCPFYMVNKNPKAKHDIVKRAEPLPPPGLRPKIMGDAPLQSKAPQQQGGLQQPTFQLPKAALAAPNTGPSQPVTKPSILSSLTSSASSSPFSLTPPSSSQPAAVTSSSSPFNFGFPTTLVKPGATETKSVSSDGVPVASTKSLFTTDLFGRKSDTTLPPGSGFSNTGFPTEIGFPTTPVRPVATETKSVSSDGVPVASTKSLFTTDVFGRKSDTTLPPGSGFSNTGFPTGIASSVAGPPEKPASQLPSSTSSFPNMFSSRQPSTLTSSDKPAGGTTIFKPMPTTQPLSTPKETDLLKGTTSTELSMGMEQEKQQIKKQEEIKLQQQQQQREQEQQQQLQRQQQEQQRLQLQPLKQDQEQLQQNKQEQLERQQELRQRQLEQQQQQRFQQLLQRQTEQEEYQQQLQQHQQQEERQLLQRQQEQLKRQQELQQRQLEQQQQQRQQQLLQRQQEQEEYQQQLQQRQQQEERQLLQRQQEQQERQRQEQLLQRQQEQQQLEQRGQPLTKENLELSLSKCISEEIQLFSKELKKLAKDVHQVKNVCSEFAQAEELERLRVETEVETKMGDELKQVAKDHNSEVQDAKKKLLGSFEVLEDARVRHHRAKDRRYLHLLKSRGLDPMNANKMKTIRELYMYLDKTLGEVNLVLDEEWNKENESQNKIQRPTMDAIYRTLQAHQRVAQDQSVRLDKIADKMKRKKLLSLSWNKPSASIVSSRENVNELSSLEGSMKSLDLETTTRSSLKVPDNIPANKSAQLINILRKRQTTPIRKSTVVSPDTSRAKQIQKRLAKPITNLSPPSHQEHIAAETPLVKSTSATEPLYSSTPAVTNGQGDAFLYEKGKPRDSIINKESVYQTSRQSPNLFTSMGAKSAAQTTGPTRSFSAQPQSTDTPPPSTATTGVSPQITGPRQLFDKTGFSSQRTGTPPLSGGTSYPTGTPQMLNYVPPSRGMGAPLARSTGTPPFSVPPSSSEKSIEGPPSSFSSSAVTTTKEAAFKLPSTGPGDKTPVLKQMFQPTPGSPSRDMNPIALAAISRAEKMSAEKSNLDPSASIEPRSMVIHGQSGGGRARDVDSENTAARSIAEEALKYSQLEAEKGGVKPQSSTEFAFKGTESPKPGPPVVTVKPVSGKDKVPPSNVTVKPVALQGTSLMRPSIVPPVSMPPTQPFSKPASVPFSVLTTSSGATSGFSVSASNDTVSLKENVRQSSSPKPTFSFPGTSNTMKETEAIPASSLGTESSIQPKSSPLNSGIVKSDVVPSPGVSRRLFKDSSNQIKDTNDQKEQAEVPQGLQKPSESGTTVTTGTSLGFQFGSSKENVPFSAPTSTSSSSKPDEGPVSLGFKFDSPFAFPKTESPSYEAVPGKETPSSDSSSGVKLFSASSSAAGAGPTFGPTSTLAPSNVFRPFANMQSMLSSSPTSSLSSTTTSSSGFSTPASFSFSSKETSSTTSAPLSAAVSSGVSSSTPASFSFSSKEASSTTSAPLSAAVSSGVSSSGLLNLTSKSTADFSIAVSSVTSPGTKPGLKASPFSSFTSSAPGSSQGGSTVTATESTKTAQGGTSQGGLLGTATTTSQGGAAPGGLFETATTSSQGGTPQGGLFGPKTTAATTTTTQGGLFGTTPSSQGGALQGGLFGPKTTAATTTTTQGGLFGTPPSSQGEALQGGLFGTKTTATTTTTTQGSVFGTPTTSQIGTPQESPFGAKTTSSQGGLFGTTTTTSQGGTAQGSPFGAKTTASQGGLFGTTTTTSQGGLFGTTTTSQGGTAQGSPFGAKTTASEGGLFGATTTTSQEGTSQGGLFGTPTTISQGGTPQGGLFGAKTTASQGGLFGTATTSQGGLFGAVTTTSQGGTPQGGLFGSSQAGGLFGASTTSQSGTGQFGLPSSSTSSAFGQPSFGQPGFGQPTSTVTSPTSSAFSRPQETTSTGTGLSFGGFGLGGPPSEQANKNPFLTSGISSPSTGSSLFGASTSAGFKPAFGSGSPSSFGSQPSSGFGGGSFSKGTGNVATSGFSLGAGSGSSGFGGPPSFGSASAFGSSPSFGSSAPAFGSVPVFGSSPQLGMGSTGGSFGSTASGSFGSVSGSPTFGALAHQNTTPSFGNVAQQAQQGQGSFGGFGQQPTAFGGFGSPGGGAGANPSFGGSPSQSFNNWR